MPATLEAARHQRAAQRQARSNAPTNVRDVEVTLIVQATTSDAQTKQLRAVELHGRGRRINPNQ
jgi:hypothetical protein